MNAADEERLRGIRMRQAQEEERRRERDAAPEKEAAMIDRRITERCKTRLIAVARARETITYSALASFLGVANQSVGLYLNEVYAEEIPLGHPDLTVVVVYAGTGMGRYNSRGGPAQSVRVDPDNRSDVAKYRAELERVYDHWAT